jgi:hypothetical protein
MKVEKGLAEATEEEEEVTVEAVEVDMVVVGVEAAVAGEATVAEEDMVADTAGEELIEALSEIVAQSLSKKAKKLK